jgi:hypothetical protein
LRESTQSHIVFTLKGEPISGALLIQAIEAAQEKHGFRGFFSLLWEPHYLDNKKCKRARILRRLASNGTGDPRQSYGFFLTRSYKLCQPLVINPDEMYDQFYLVIDSWGENFKQQMLHGGFEKFLDTCRGQGEKLTKAIEDAIQDTLTGRTSR